MKKLILLSMLLGFSYLSKAQCTLPYKSLSQFNNDTTAFVKYNFSDRAACYVGKTIKNVIQDLGIPVQSFLPYVLGRNATLYGGTYIYMYPEFIISQKIYNKQNANGIWIDFAVPIDVNVFSTFTDKTYPDMWTPQLANYLMNVQIQSIGIVRSISGLW